MSRTPYWLALLLGTAFTLCTGAARAADPVRAQSFPDTLVFKPESAATDSARAQETGLFRIQPGDDGESRRAPYGDDLLTHPYFWRTRHPSGAIQTDLNFAYDRVDLFRYGVAVQAQRPETMLPRIAGMLGYSTGRARALYGLQFEQPLLPTARFVLGVSASRRTDHGDLQQLDDAENSLLLLVAHEDWRDYFEREGLGAYLSWRVPKFSTVSVHVRSDRYRSLEVSRHVRSWWRSDRPLRGNPAIDDGDAHRVVVRLERMTRHPRRGRSGLYHWVEFEGAGGPLGGDFDYSRALADVRSVVRLSPATTLTLRGVGGSAVHGALPRQRQFTIGGVDGLRAHAFGSFRGDRVALAQVEYGVGLQSFNARTLGPGPRVLLFLDTGTAWDHATQGELVAQRFAADGGIGLATADDDLRLSLARNLREPDSPVVVTLRLQRPF